MNFSNFPWTKKIYKNIVYEFQLKKLHHATLIQSPSQMGKNFLIKKIGYRILCTSKERTYNCNYCNSCNLLKSKNHPDLHKIKLNKKKSKSIGIEIIRNVISKILKKPKQKKNKVILISKITLLTKSALHALLKILEEPPKNTWFLIGYNYSTTILPALKSRCIIRTLRVPLEEKSIKWLKTHVIKKYNHETYISALRITDGIPISAKNSLISKNIYKRKNFFLRLMNSILKNNLLSLFSLLNNNDFQIFIYYIYTILTDVIKFKLKLFSFFTNLDQKKIIKVISKKYNYFCVKKSISSWINCRYLLLNNWPQKREIILIEQLINWEIILKENKKKNFYKKKLIKEDLCF